MTTTTEASTLPPEDVLAHPADMRVDLRRLTIASAQAWLDTPYPPVQHEMDPVLVAHMDVGRVAVWHLIHELERVDQPHMPAPPVVPVDQRAVNRAGLAQARQMLTASRIVCPGSNLFVHEDSTDGNGIITCPVCERPRPTTAHPEPLMRTQRTIDPHTLRHPARCHDADGKLECVCGLTAHEERFA